MALGHAYFLAAAICTVLIDDGWSKWLYLLLVYNGMKFILMGPISLILLARARIREAIAHRRVRKLIRQE